MNSNLPTAVARGVGAHLRRINRITIGTAVAIVGVIITLSSFVVGIYSLIGTARTQARILADSATAPLMFNDDSAAQELLQSLRTTPDVQYCALYSSDGRLFAAYSANGRAAIPQRLAASSGGYSVVTGRVDLQQPIQIQGNKPGTLQLSVSVVGLLWQLAIQIVITLFATALALAVSGQLVRRLNGAILRPLQGLNRLMDRVSTTADFTARVEPSGITELDSLASGFNDMLGNIQERDARLAAQRDHLEEQVTARTADLKRAKDVAEAASKAKSEFLATMSHEIRTPLNGVLGMNEMLLASALEPSQREWATTVHTSGQHLLNVINDILDFSKIESGHMELESNDFNIADLVDETLTMFAPTAQAKGLEIAAHCAPAELGLAWLRGDPFRLRQALANLIGNAIKFTERGEVVVKVQLQRHGASAVALTLCVTDTGIGIAPEARDRIFESFSQADGSTTRRYGGTGLGLAICRRLLGLMGGGIRVESESRRGSQFIIDLCLPMGRAPTGRQLIPPSLDGVRVLLVDDNQTNRAILGQQLGSWNMRVASVAGGAEALELLARVPAGATPFDLMILDLHMPGMDGLQLAKAIRLRPALSHTPLLLLTSAVISLSDVERAGAGIHCHLSKPVRRADLQRAIRAAITSAPVEPAHVTPALVPITAPQRGSSVLVVEDNVVNQTVVVAMLATFGINTTVAENGQQAVDLVRAGNFDLVLMDCQMPVMDGYEATVTIRGLPESRGARLPIVAVTGNAMQSDRLKCQQAGMDDFLAKPFLLADLRAILTRWLPKLNRTQTGTAAPAPTGDKRPVPTPFASVINMQQLATLRTIGATAGKDLVSELLQRYLDSADTRVGAIADAVRARDGAELARLAHALKSSAANVGADALAGCHRQLESLGRQGRYEEADAQLVTLRLEHDHAVARMREILREDR